MTRLLPLLLVAAACGPSIPAHNGYPVNAKPPWNTAKRIILNERNMAQADGTISYAQRARAAWYTLPLDEPGDVKVTMSLDGAKEGTDIDVEVLDTGYNVIAASDPDEAADKAVVEAKDLPKGKNFIHVYTHNKTDEADYELKVAFTPHPDIDPNKQFPNTVPMPGQLAAIPPADDAPAVKKVVHHDTGHKDEPKPDKPDVTAGKVKAKIAEYSDEGSSVRIVIDKGSDDGVEVGWTGYIVSRITKKKVPGSDFTIKTARPSESEATVAASANDVEANRTVVLSKGSN